MKDFFHTRGFKIMLASVFVLLGLLIPLLTYRVIARHTIVERLRDGE